MTSIKQLVKYCIEKQIDIVTMESCTGGGLADKLTNIEGASTIIKDSFITYSNNSKINLGVKGTTINKFTVYSKEVALEMALAARNQSVSMNPLGIGITGSLSRADPNNMTNSIPGEVHFALAYNQSKAFKINVDNNLKRNKAKDYIIKRVINEAYKFLK